MFHWPNQTHVGHITNSVGCFNSKVIKKILVYEHGSCNINQSSVLLVNNTILLSCSRSWEVMINSFFQHKNSKTLHFQTQFHARSLQFCSHLCLNHLKKIIEKNQQHTICHSPSQPSIIIHKNLNIHISTSTLNFHRPT